MWSLAFSAVRAYRGALLGSGIIVLVAAALLSATGVLLETGLRDDLPMLATLTASFAGTAVIVVLLVVASTFASALRPRLTQFALLRAVGATGGQVRRMVTEEIILVFAVAAPVGAIPGLFVAGLLAPVLTSAGILSEGSALAISPLPAIGAVLLLLPTALVAGLLAAREVTRVSPNAALRETASERPTLSRARRIVALVLLVSGLVVAALPFFVPGTIGSAAGASSALLLIAAAALGGPLIVAAAAGRLARATRSSRNAALVLALVNARGFSRRLTAAVVPLALLLALGTVQTGVNGAMTEAAGAQLSAGLRGDSVVTGSGGVTAEQAEAVSSAPGVEAVVASSVVAAEVRAESDDGGLGWEQTAVRTVDGDVSAVIDPRVTSGSLDDLVKPGTIAVSGDSLFATGKSVGDPVDVRFGDSPAAPLTIVAVYDRGLGFGDYLVGATTVPAEVRPATSDVLFVRDGADLAGLGVQTVSAAAWVDQAVTGAASQQQLGAVLLFVLLFFIAVAAANTLVMLTAVRRQEFVLLGRVGATRGQIARMLAIESGFVVATALVLGTLAVLPALAAVSYGLVGALSLAIDWPVYAGLAAAVVVVGALSTIRPRRMDVAARP